MSNDIISNNTKNEGLSEIPFVSILIPSYNRAKYIKATVLSALAQDYQNFEVVVVDDGSTDNTAEILAELDDPRLSYVQKEHSGAPDTRNRCLKEAGGEYVQWLGSDDELMPGVLTHFLTVLDQHSEIDIIYSDLEIFTDQGGSQIHRYDDHHGDENLLSKMLRFNAVPDGGSLVKKSLYERFGGYDKGFRRAHDYEFWCRVVKLANIKHSGIVSYRWRWHDSNMSSGTVKIDTSFDAGVVKKLCNRFGIVELFPELNWTDRDHATTVAWTTIGDILKTYKDYDNAVIAYEQALRTAKDNSTLVANIAEAVGLIETVSGEYVSELEISSKAIEASPLVSVIVPTMNRPDLLERALKSLVNQTYKNWQAVVVNDAGEDVQELVLSIDPLNRIEYISHQENQGLPSSRNTAIQASTGSVICYLDDDDVFLPEHITTVIDTLQTNQADFVYCEAIYVEEENQDGNSIEISRSTPYSGISYSKDRLDISNFIPVNTWGHKRDLLEKSGLFDKSLTSLEDWEMLLRFSRLTHFIHVPKLTVEVHQRIASGNDHMLNRERNQFPQLFRKLYDRYPVTNNEVQEKRIELLASWGIEYQPKAIGLTQQCSKKASTPLEKALVIHEYLGAGLAEVARMMVRNNPKDYSESNAKHALYYDVAEEILHRNEQKKFKSDELSGNSIREALHLLSEVLGEVADIEKVQALREQLREFQETKDYQRWIRKHQLQEIDGQLFAERMVMQWSQKPVFHCIMFLFPGEENLLADTLDAFGSQLYQDWRLTVIAETPAPDPLWDELDVLNWVEFKEGDHPYELLNSQIAAIPADWVALIEPGTRLTTYALVQIGDYINIRPDWKLIYTDEDEIEKNGDRIKPKFKPDFNLDLLRSAPYVGNFCVIEKDSLLQMGGFESVPNLENYDAVFKVYDLMGERAIGHIDEVLFHKPAASKRAIQDLDIQSTIKRHLDRNAIKANVEAGYFNNSFRVNYKHQDQPKVTIVIPTKDQLDFLVPCVESLLHKTAYPNYEVIIVDNQSADPDVFEFFSELKQKYSERVKVIDFPKAFNFSAICNYAADQATGEYLLLLNNDTEVLHAEWLDRMMAYAMRDDVGIVGARLVYPESGILQHAGIVMGMESIAGHPFNGNLHIKEPGYMGRAQLDQNYSAVTGACLLIETKIYQSVQGMDEQQFAVSYNDVDLCLKVQEAGYRNVWTPFATLIHHGSITQLSDVVTEEKQQRFKNERESLFKKWQKIITNDPSYNRHLSLVNLDYSVEHAMPCNWDVKFHDRLRILGVPLEGGSGDYRVIQPFDGLSKSGLAQCEYIRLKQNEYRAFSISEIARQQADVLVLHSVLSDQQLQLLEQCKRLLPELFIIYMMDDLVNQIPEKSSAYKRMKRNFRNAKPRIRKALSFCDRAVVSTQPLADFCQGMIDDIKVVPNSLEKQVWLGLDTKPNQGNKLRIGWAGALQHQGDLEIISEVVRQTANEVDWVFMGMCPESIKPYIKEFQEPVPISEYPKRLAGLKLDLAIAPLEDNAFNEAKSNLRLLEYGILGWPVICSNVYPYRGAPVTCVENSTESWLSAIRHAIENRDNLPQQGDELRQWVLKDYLLEDNLEQWLDALTPKSLQFKADNTFLSNSDKTHSVE